MFIVSRVLTDDPRSKLTKMTIILLAPSDINSYSATVDSGNTNKTVKTTASNGAVLFAAFWRDEKFGFITMASTTSMDMVRRGYDPATHWTRNVCPFLHTKLDLGLRFFKAGYLSEESGTLFVQTCGMGVLRRIVLDM
ncbi:hypothetical protein EC957_006753 [Mortierella hygrophila]|uniref:Uncharacterized protein n=1 Tax=Mortierella hygrophila TaxID=979708 RepID=A0A9P6EZF9_9FUNG|nr:hypothetical protein EC957_006753 [Mortierella hygrophila]